MEVRYVFDVGSSNTKSMCCLVEVSRGRILAILDHITVEMPYQKLLEESNQILTAEMMELGTQSIKNIISYYNINPFNENIKCGGVATAWSRYAQNSKDYLEKIKNETGIDILPISQYEEGCLGIKALLANPLCDMPPSDQIIMLDIGGGSFQLSYLNDDKKISVHNGQYGATNFKQKFYDTMENEEYKHYLASPTLNQNISEEVLYKVSAGITAYGIGGFLNRAIKPIFIEAMVDDIIDIENVASVLQNKMFNDQVQESNLMLLYGIMNDFNLKKITLIDHVKNLDAIAVWDEIWADCYNNDDNNLLFENTIDFYLLPQSA